MDVLALEFVLSPVLLPEEPAELAFWSFWIESLESRPESLLCEELRLEARWGLGAIRKEGGKKGISERLKLLKGMIIRID